MMTIHLPEELEHFVQDEVLSGRFASRDEAIAEAVRLLQQRSQGQAQDAGTEGATSTSEPIWKRVLENMKDVPDADFDRIPSDSSEQLDHYLYGTPKRSTP